MAVQPSIGSLARSYRSLVLWFGAQIALSFVALAVRPLLGEALVGVVVVLAVMGGLLLSMMALARYGYRTARTLGSDVPWIWALAMFVPWAGLVAVLALSFRATQACAALGVPVGLLGPKVVPPEDPQGGDVAG